MKILKNGNVSLESVIEYVRRSDVPAQASGDPQYDRAYSEGYNAALNDVYRSLVTELNAANIKRK